MNAMSTTTIRGRAAATTADDLPAAQAGPVTKQQPKPRKSYSVSLTDASGATLRISAVRRADGTAVAFAVHTVKDGKKRVHKHSAKSPHPTFEAARAHVDELAADARTKRGWTPRKAGGGFQARPPDFDLDHLPAGQPARAAKR